MREKFLKISFPFIFMILVALFVLQPDYQPVSAATVDIDAESAILVDADTGKVLFSKNSDNALPPASMTKMMTEYLVWEAIESGDIDWDTTTEISDYAYSISANSDFSGVGLQQDIDYTVRSLYEAMAINSDNATSIALAELIAGSEGEFVKLMNEKGEEMGLPNFKFVNSTGLENKSLDGNHPEGTEADGLNLLSAESSALLAYNLVNDFPESLEVSSQPEFEFDDKIIPNWNWMLEHKGESLKQFHFEGVDGLKTGFTEEAGYCFTGTAMQDDKRLISVVMKTSSEEERFKQTAKLLDYGFKEFEMKELFPKGYQLEDESTLPVIKGKEKTVEVELNDPINTVIKKGEEEKYRVKYKIDKDKLNKDGELTAPIEKGEKVGQVELVYDGDVEGFISKKDNESVDLVTTEKVDKKNWFMLMLSAIGSFFAMLFTEVVDFVKGWF